MKVQITVHGFVQGVGYRAFVKGVADRYDVKGMVRNVSDGSVEIVAIGDPDSLLRFERDISIYKTYGPKPLELNKFYEKDKNFPSEFTDKECYDFTIEGDKDLDG